MEKDPIKDTTVFLMIFTALCFDGIQALIGWIPVVGNIFADLFSIFIFLTFFLWFKMHGISMMTPKRFGAMAGAGFAEMIPYVNLLPAWTGVVVYLIGTTKIKELAGKHPALAKTAGAMAGRINESQPKAPNTPMVDKKESKEETLKNNTASQVTPGHPNTIYTSKSDSPKYQSGEGSAPEKGNPLMKESKEVSEWEERLSSNNPNLLDLRREDEIKTKEGYPNENSDNHKT